MSKRISKSQLAGIIVIAGLVLPMWVYFDDPLVLEKMGPVISNNPGFWIAILFSIAFGLFRKFTNPKEFIWLELPVQIIAGVFAAYVIFMTLFYTSTELSDTEIWNGYITTAELLEEWDEEREEEVCDSRDDNGNCTSSHTETYIVHHPEERYLHTSNGEKKSISKKHYKSIVEYFGNEKEENLFHMNQVSIGDGDRFFTVNPGGEKLIPTAVEHSFVNYLAASDSIRLRKGSLNTFKKFLLPYPRVHSGKFGPIEVNRVLTAGGIYPSEWIKNLDRELELSLAFLGKKKKANILVYVVNTTDQSFIHSLEEHWVNGKKNDIIVIIGSISFPKTDWVGVIAWTDIEEFKISLRNNILDLENLSDSKTLANIITKQVSLPGSKGGFIKKSMEDYEYLISDISLPFWANALIFVSICFVNWLVSWALINNSFSKDENPKRRRY